MRRLKSMFLCLTLVLTLGLAFHPTPAMASDPQNTTLSQGGGGGTPTLGDSIRIIMIVLSR